VRIGLTPKTTKAVVSKKKKKKEGKKKKKTKKKLEATTSEAIVDNSKMDKVLDISPHAASLLMSLLGQGEQPAKQKEGLVH
jgi:hypothetical protein